MESGYAVEQGGILIFYLAACLHFSLYSMTCLVHYSIVRLSRRANDVRNGAIVTIWLEGFVCSEPSFSSSYSDKHFVDFLLMF
jgi:hypothetical protein